jgi:hypothetical protein
MLASFQVVLSVKSKVVSHEDVFDISNGVHSSRPRSDGVVTIAAFPDPPADIEELSLEVELRSRGTKAQSLLVHGRGVALYEPSAVAW